MKQIGESIIKSTISFLGRWTKVATLGCLLALAFCVTAGAQSQSPGKARPFKATGIFTMVAGESGLAGTFEVVGNATHLGNIVFAGTYEIVGATETGLVTFHIHGIYTAANGDSIEVDCPNWLTQYDAGGKAVTSTGSVNIIGGTGRFANASGSYVGNIFPGDPMPFAANGTISY